ncbi:Sel1 repeat [Geosmithia morbida]|uniref:Sel1 repeat n=1 Tax=Geosmithia morbida TaxID=1094350 RepID=A0A9P4YX65_9HYPO|nr:Sel1 repeat [Geosmithia morbida]KAF4124167.1 Sel1 repeat [Geosmithia morbida]
MAQQRPNLLDLRANSHSSAMSSVSRPLRSPRLHVAGEAPPELSPLDAFALQSRMLAKQLQASEKDGQRLSRLPPLTVESPLMVQGRSDYFRSMSTDAEAESLHAQEGNRSPESSLNSGLGLRTEYQDAFGPEERPRSMHPRMSSVPPSSHEPMPEMRPPPVDFTRPQPQLNRDQTSFGTRQERSPSPFLNNDIQPIPDQNTERLPVRNDNAPTSGSPLQTSTPADAFDGPNPGSLDDIGLAPPRPVFPKRSSSIMSSPLSPSEEDGSASLSGSFNSLPPRKLSSSSTAFANNPAVTPSLNQLRRTPSAGSESSALPRPSFNFSRPMSRSGTPSFDAPSRQASCDSQPSFFLADETMHTPVSMHSDAFTDNLPEDYQAAPSYIYSKFALPRGKVVQRGEGPENQNQAASSSRNAPPSPPSRPTSSSYVKPVADDAASVMSSLTRPSTDSRKPSFDSSRLAVDYPPPPTGRQSQDENRSSEEIPRGRARSPRLPEPPRGRTPTSNAPTSDTASTVRPPPTARSGTTVSDMSAEEHLAKGISCHENGSLQESTYHLRHAARMNNPTAMLLYALACRHGWGMRANQKEGVQWLRKAADYAQIEIADDEDQAKDGKHVDAIERRTRKAQFALSIYELGVSHMNGWGIEQDKALGLRCFEIAGSELPPILSHIRVRSREANLLVSLAWGDVDALAEAGFCYAQGIGCKKNLKKSAKFYRMAEAKGMSMVGNSWIHKAKYNMDEEEASPTKKEKDKKKSRSKSRTRSMFTRKAAAS